MNFLFMADNLVTHSSIKCPVSPFFLVMSVVSHHPHILHLCCSVQLHCGGVYPDTSQRCTVTVHKHGTCRLLGKYKNKCFHYENGQALEQLAREVVLCTQPGDSQNFRGQAFSNLS